MFHLPQLYSGVATVGLKAELLQLMVILTTTGDKLSTIVVPLGEIEGHMEEVGQMFLSSGQLLSAAG